MRQTVSLETVKLLDAECYPQNPLSDAKWDRVQREVDGLAVGYSDSPGRAYYLIQQTVDAGGPLVRLLRLGVGPECRRLGMGKQLLQALEEVNCEATVSLDNRAALGLLTSQGFQAMGLGERDRVLLWRRGVVPK